MAESLKANPLRRVGKEASIRSGLGQSPKMKRKVQGVNQFGWISGCWWGRETDNRSVRLTGYLGMEGHGD